jgi:acyl-CoA thioester hydrolase
VNGKISDGRVRATTIKARVLYADTDQMGVVNHATYLRWFEACRASYMRRRGSAYAAVEHDGLHLPVVEAHLDYLKPARYDDVIAVEGWIADLGLAQLRFEYEITRDDDLLVRGYTRHAAVSRAGRPTRLPEEIRVALQGPEKTDGGQVE